MKRNITKTICYALSISLLFLSTVFIISKQNISAEENIISEELQQNTTEDTQTTNAEEPIDSWMPDTELQQTIANTLGVEVDDITKQMLAEYEGHISVWNNDETQVYDYTGVEYFSNSTEFTVVYSAYLGSQQRYNFEPLIHVNLNTFQLYPGTDSGNYSALAPLIQAGLVIDIQAAYYVQTAEIEYADETQITSFESFSIPFNSLFNLGDAANLISLEESYFPYMMMLETENYYLYYNVTYENGNFIFQVGEEFSEEDIQNFENEYRVFQETPINVRERWTNPIFTSYFTINGRTSSLAAFPNIRIVDEAMPVTVFFRDTAGNDLSTPVVLNGNIGDSYESIPAEIENYILVEVPFNATGLFTDEEQTVIYVYEKIENIDNGSEPDNPNAGDNLNNENIKGEKTETQKINDSDIQSVKTADYTNQAQLILFGAFSLLLVINLLKKWRTANNKKHE